MPSWKELFRSATATMLTRFWLVRPQSSSPGGKYILPALHKEAPRRDFPREVDMLAEFGLDPTYDSDSMSYTYTFHSPADQMELIVTFSEQMRFVAVTLRLKGAELITVDSDNVGSLRIVKERGACWLQASHDAQRARPDMYIHLEPNLKFRW
jgi:hypothetical protein